MRDLKDFNTEKSIYIGKVLDHIHYKKLHSRIYEEISNHMDDMYEDFSSTCDDEKEVTRKVLEEMGHPHYLGLELKKTNKAKLFWARVFKLAIGISVIPLVLFGMVLISNIYNELHTYFYATDIETKEIQIVENYNNGESIHLLTEIEHDGIVYRYYLPDKQPENKYVFFKTKSIKVFGISVKDKFVEHGMSSGPDSNQIRLGIGNTWIFNDYLWVLYGETDSKYIKKYYEPIDQNSGLKPYWSDFIEIPQNGTYENPIIIYMKIPEGYRWNTYKYFDENKEEYVYPKEEKEPNSHSSVTIE
ncbi:MAG: hypothetical protein IKU41_03135 [Clostridia bacterium]|nr:hypothetical protein [Clostridia bacterium]